MWLWISIACAQDLDLGVKPEGELPLVEERVSCCFSRDFLTKGVQQEPLRVCYAQALARGPWEGRVVLRFRIRHVDGQVTEASVTPTLPDPLLTQCLVDEMETWTFGDGPLCAGEGFSWVRYPLHLVP